MHTPRLTRILGLYRADQAGGIAQKLEAAPQGDLMSIWTPIAAAAERQWRKAQQDGTLEHHRSQILACLQEPAEQQQGRMVQILAVYLLERFGHLIPDTRNGIWLQCQDPGSGAPLLLAHLPGVPCVQLPAGSPGGTPILCVPLHALGAPGPWLREHLDGQAGEGEGVR